MIFIQATRITKKYNTRKLTNNEFSNFSFSDNEASNYVNKFSTRQKRKRLEQIKKRQHKLAINRYISTKIQILNIKKSIYEKVDIYAKMNLINHVFVQKLNFFLCIDISVINVQNINDKALKKTVVYFVRFFIFDFKNINRYFEKSFLNFDLN